MESEVESGNINTYFPTTGDFTNFKAFIRSVEKEIFESGAIRAAKVSKIKTHTHHVSFKYIIQN